MSYRKSAPHKKAGPLDGPRKIHFCSISLDVQLYIVDHKSRLQADVLPVQEADLEAFIVRIEIKNAITPH